MRCMRVISIAVLLTSSVVAQEAVKCDANMPSFGAPDVPLFNGYAVDGTFTFNGVLGGDCDTEPRLPCRFFFEVRVDVTWPVAAGAGDFQVCVASGGLPVCVPIPLKDVSGPNPPPFVYQYWQSFPGYQVPCGSWVNLELQENPGLGFINLAWAYMTCSNC